MDIEGGGSREEVKFRNTGREEVNLRNVLRAAFYSLVISLLLQLIFSLIYFPSETFPSIVSHCPDTFPLQKNIQAG